MINVIEMKITDLKPYKNNPRRNAAAVAAVAASIEEFGFKVPIIVDAVGEVVAGHTRLLAAKQLKLKTVPCIVAEDLSPAQIKAFRLADNKTAELAEWDDGLLALELGELAALDFDMAPFGFDSVDFIEVVEDEFDVDAAMPEEPVARLGDVYQLGPHRLMCGDSTCLTDVEKLMGGALADLVVTDPPYNVNYGNKAEMLNGIDRGGRHTAPILNDNMGSAAFRAFLTDAFTNMFLSVKPGASAYIFHSDTEGYNFRGAFCDAGFKLAQTCIWVKNSMVMGRQDYQWQHEPVLCGDKENEDEDEWNPVLYGWHPKFRHGWHTNRRQKTVWFFDKPMKSAEHPTMKPIKLTAYPIENSCAPGDVVLDLFGGSGSTLIAAQQTRRVCFMMEMEPKYIDVIIARWETFTGEHATRVVD